MKKVISILSQIAGLTLALVGGTAQALELPSYVHLRSISHAGSGCAAGTVAENVSADGQAFTLLFDSYIAQIGPGVPLTEKRKNCQINLDLDFPQGWSFTIASIDYRGYGSLQRGVTGLQKATYYFQGDARQVSGQTTFSGPFDQDYQARDQIGLIAEVWSPCGATRALNINSQVRLDNTRSPRSSGILTVDSIDGSFVTVFNLKWKRCR
ncbi:hypothetical protein E3A20_23810 [Planctomyces bekefii]|uniref:Secreted protein n=1 Tax=Planctomyces bekefii TaxID=1653850 RepID=A0A5C6M650_9PLAN|nr:hypothetical protein E3A20_23810 [Planctomyces bekefii]